MQNKEILILIIVIIFLLTIWIYSRLLKEKRLREELGTENRLLIADNALLEAEHLKFQLQPHTLRNMVATLHVASKNLYRGSEALSDTLDYVLYHGNKHLVSIHDELTFLKNYKSLQGNFVHQIDSIKIEEEEVDTECKHFNSACIPHMITAYFVENAFKHGDVNHPEFLTISLKLSDKSFEMLVINRIKHKDQNGNSGIGLVNMQKRLDLLLTGQYELKNFFKDQEYHSYLKINF